MMKQAHALPTLTQWLKLLGVAALYALSSWLIESHFVPNGEETIFFLPSGLALAAVLLGGKRYTGSVALGALLGNMLFGSPFLASALMASGSALAAFIGACLVQRHGRFDSTLSTLPDVVRLWFFGSFIASTVSAVIGTLALLLTGLVSNEAFASNLIQWWMGDTMGVVLVTPLILAWWPTPAQPYKRPSLKLCAEYVLILGLTVLAAGIVLLAWLHPLVPTELQFWVGTLARDYWLFLLIVWAAMRLGLRGTCLALLLVALLGQIGVHNGVGFFGASRDDLAQLSNYWLHTIILSVVGMTLGIHIAASRKMNNSLRESESTLTQEFNHIMTAVDQHSIVAVTDGLERITWVNDKLCDISGYSSDELIGETHTLFKSGMQPHSLFEALHQTLSTGNVWQGEICNRAKDGSLYWLQTTITPFIGDNGKPEKYVNISTDISDNKRLEALALAGNSAKSDFLANMSHEIRTPMNGVIGMVDILQQTKLTPAQKRMLDTVQKSSMALLTIVNDILDFSKIESGKLQIENISFHLRDLAESVAQLMVATTVTRAIDLYVYVSPALPAWVLSDPTRLRQVLLNLLGNAVKFTSGRNSYAARVMLFVEPCTLPQGGPGFQMRVSDSGIGMSAETQEKLFQPFTQADESTSRKFGGSGLGLEYLQAFD